MPPSVPDDFTAELDLLRSLLDGVLRAEAPAGLADDVASLEAAVVAGDVDGAEVLVAELSEERADHLARAFTVQLHLVNLAEEREHARRLRAEEHDAADGESLWPALRGLVEPEVLDALEIRPVLTAHPTEARRRAVVAASRRIAQQLHRYGDPRNGPVEQGVARRRLAEEVELLWRTGFLRRTPPGPLDEVRTVLAMFEQTLLRIVPRLYRTTEAAAEVTDLGSDPPGVPAFVRFGTWIGGDRDGNPNVTAAITRDAVGLQADTGLRLLAESTARVGRALTVNEVMTPPSPELCTRLEMVAAAHPTLTAEIAVSSPGEPHRQLLLSAAARLDAARRRDLDLGYRRAGDLLDDLRLVQRSLVSAGARRAAYGELQHLIWQVETFGFHLAELEVRQHSRVHRAALVELLDQVPDLGASGEEAAVDPVLLDRLSVDGWPGRPTPTSPATEEVLATFRVMATLQDRWGPECCGRYIISFTQHAADLAAVTALARLAVGDTPLRLEVVPLFETHDDLRRAVPVLEEWTALAGAAKRLQDGGRRMEVMVGYSDSAKDVGPTSATLTLYDAQAELVAWANGRDVGLTLFHGRGGSLGRGGGPVHRALLAQPPGSVSGRFKVTEQGEVVAARYGDATIGQRHLERVTAAVVEAGSEAVASRNDAAADRFRDLGRRLEAAAREAYLELVGCEGFADFFAAVSPLEEIGRLRLGSRPPKRAGALVGRDLADLRAIPWVFAWAQARVNLAGWYGLGTGLRAAGSVGELRAAYRDWPLFTMLVDTAEMSLAKTHAGLAERYLALGGRPDLSERILHELHRTTSAVLEVVEQPELLAGKARLHEALARRSAPVDALSHLQLRALRRIRSGAADEHTESQLLVTVNGVAAGLQNTG